MSDVTNDEENLRTIESFRAYLMACAPDPSPVGAPPPTNNNRNSAALSDVTVDAPKKAGGSSGAKTRRGGTKKKGKKGKPGTAAEDETYSCFHCESDGAKMCCSQCHSAWYCGKACQKKHWKQHKRACTAAVAAKARNATRTRDATAASAGRTLRDKETCVICIGPVVAPVELPCGHAYCGVCLAELRRKKVAQTYPMCRAQLPPGLEGLYGM